MQKAEIVEAILAAKRKNPKITNKQLSLRLKLHRNTISKYVKYIRQNIIKTPEEIVNKIDQRLNEELDNMTHNALLSYRFQLVPRKAEIKTELSETLTEIKVLVIDNSRSSVSDAPEAT